MDFCESLESSKKNFFKIFSRFLTNCQLKLVCVQKLQSLVNIFHVKIKKRTNCSLIEVETCLKFFLIILYVFVLNFSEIYGLK